MKKNLGMAFIISLIVFIILNFLFWIISYSIIGWLDTSFILVAEEPRWLLAVLFGPMGQFPWLQFEYAVSSTGSYEALKILYIGHFFAFIIAAIIAGLVAGNLVNAFGGWALTGIVCIVMALIAFDYVSSNEYAIVEIIVSGIVNIIFFGILALFVALIVGKSKQYYKK